MSETTTASLGWEHRLERAAAGLLECGRLPAHWVSRPHPLLLMVAHERHVVLITPAFVWDRGRELFKPFAERFASDQAMLVLMGPPREGDFAQAMNKGLASIVSDDPSADELHVAVFRALELLEAKVHAESRARTLTQYLFEVA